MEICDIQIDDDFMEITFCNEDLEDVMTIKIKKRDISTIFDAIKQRNREYWDKRKLTNHQ